uniref:Uncharacterized protein n=1 Tax=Arundo donax TaxID=35708 RepID=A0A0A9C2X9_ARUDO
MSRSMHVLMIAHFPMVREKTRRFVIYVDHLGG